MEERGHFPVHDKDAEVERVGSFKFFSMHMTEDLSWSVLKYTMV